MRKARQVVYATLEEIAPNNSEMIFRALKDRKLNDNDEEEEEEEESLDSSLLEALAECYENASVKSFQRFSSLQKHLDGERHKYTLERESLLDMAMLRYAENLESGTASIEEHHEAITSEELVEVPSAKMGWALKRTATSRRLNEKQKNYLSDLFHFGEETGRKADASDVSKSMRKARNADGSFLFKSDEYLTSLQITGFFSRLSAKKSIQVPSTSNLTDDDDDQDDVLSAMAEKDLEKMRHDVMNEISIQHPITYQSYNMCEMAAASKLSKFSITMLQDICKHFEIDTSKIKQKRKKPYIELLEALVKSCTC